MDVERRLLGAQYEAANVADGSGAAAGSRRRRGGNGPDTGRSFVQSRSLRSTCHGWPVTHLQMPGLLFNQILQWVCRC